jgi:hypothetical protein
MRDGSIGLATLRTSSHPPPGYRTQSPDTSYWAERLLFDHWRGLAPREKAEIVSALCRMTHRLSLIGLRQRHPHADEEELELRAAAQRLGRDVVERVARRRLAP